MAMNYKYLLLVFIFFIAVGSVSAIGSYPPVDPNMVLYYHFNNNASLGENYAISNVTADSSNAGNNGTYNNTNFISTSGILGDGALSFNGINTSVSPTNQTFMPHNGTISIWFNSTTATQGDIFSSNLDTRLSILYQPQQNITVQLGNPIKQINSLGNSALINTWNNVVLVYNIINSTDNNGSLYLNGVLVGTTIFNDISTGSSKIKVGSFNNGGTFFNGSIDEVTIYNRTLTASEILNIYNNYTGNYNVSLNSSILNLTITTDTGNIGSLIYNGQNILQFKAGAVIEWYNLSTWMDDFRVPDMSPTTFRSSYLYEKNSTNSTIDIYYNYSLPQQDMLKVISTLNNRNTSVQNISIVRRYIFPIIDSCNWSMISQVDSTIINTSTSKSIVYGTKQSEPYVILDSRICNISIISVIDPNVSLRTPTWTSSRSQSANLPFYIDINNQQSQYQINSTITYYFIFGSSPIDVITKYRSYFTSFYTNLHNLSFNGNWAVIHLKDINDSLAQNMARVGVTNVEVDTWQYSYGNFSISLNNNWGDIFNHTTNLTYFNSQLQILKNRGLKTFVYFDPFECWNETALATYSTLIENNSLGNYIKGYQGVQPKELNNFDMNPNINNQFEKDLISQLTIILSNVNSDGIYIDNLYKSNDDFAHISNNDEWIDNRLFDSTYSERTALLQNLTTTIHQNNKYAMGNIPYRLDSVFNFDYLTYEDSAPLDNFFFPPMTYNNYGSTQLVSSTNLNSAINNSYAEALYSRLSLGFVTDSYTNSSFLDYFSRAKYSLQIIGKQEYLINNTDKINNTNVYIKHYNGTYDVVTIKNYNNTMTTFQLNFTNSTSYTEIWKLQAKNYSNNQSNMIIDSIGTNSTEAYILLNSPYFFYNNSVFGIANNNHDIIDAFSLNLINNTLGYAVNVTISISNNGLIYFQNLSSIQVSNNINVTLDPNNYSYVLDNYNLTEGVNRQFDPLWFSSSTATTKHIASNLTNSVNVSVTVNFDSTKTCADVKGISYTPDTGSPVTSSYTCDDTTQSISITTLQVDPAQNSNILTILYTTIPAQQCANGTSGTLIALSIFIAIGLLAIPIGMFFAMKNGLIDINAHSILISFVILSVSLGLFGYLLNNIGSLC